MRSVDDLRADVQRALDRVHRHAVADEKMSFHEFERELWKQMLAAGVALVALFLARRAAKARAVDYEHDGRRYRLTGKWRTTTLGTRFGKVSFSRPGACGGLDPGCARPLVAINGPRRARPAVQMAAVQAQSTCPRN